MHAAHDTAWQTIDQALIRLASRKGQLDAEIARWLLAASNERVHRRLGFGSFEEYVGRRLGYDARTTREKLRVARSRESLPTMRALMQSGARSWSAVREISRVATPETEAEWIAKTQGLTVRQVEAMVAGREEGDRPTDPKDPLLTTRRVVFELESEDFALWCEAMQAVQKTLGPAATSKDVLRALAEMALGRRPEREPGYQTSLTVCVVCERAWQQSGGDAIEGRRRQGPAQAATARWSASRAWTRAWRRTRRPTWARSTPRSSSWFAPRARAVWSTLCRRCSVPLFDR